jgi:hypothetical protein
MLALWSMFNETGLPFVSCTRWETPMKAARAVRLGVIRCGLAALFLVPTSGCWDSEIAKRFRESFVPNWVAGLSAAVTRPWESDIGFRQTAVALFEALGAVITPRDSDRDN